MKSEKKRGFLGGFIQPIYRKPWLSNEANREEANRFTELAGGMPVAFSAGYVIDLENTTISLPSLNANVIGNSGVAYPASGGVIGNSINLNNANSYCNLNVNATPFVGSGQLRIQVQSSDTDVSGNYTDPTSGLAQFPSPFVSGGILILNSGGLSSGVFNNGASGQNFLSGACVYAGFQRPYTFVRANLVSGDFFLGSLQVNFISQLRTTGSGGGQSQAPSSGIPSV